MEATEIRLALHGIARSIDIAGSAARRADWAEVEQALRDVHEGSSLLLRVIGPFLPTQTLSPVPVGSAEVPIEAA